MKKVIIILCLILMVGCGGKEDSQETAQVINDNKSNKEVNDMNNENKYQTPEGFDEEKEDITYGSLTEMEYYSETTEAMRKCFVYTPPNYNTDKIYPVVYLLHGIGGTHSEWLGGNPNEIISNLIASGEVPQFIAVFPNVRAMKNDSVPSEILGQKNIDAFDNFINDLKNDLMPFIKEKYSVSEKREETAVAGLSMGGREALYIGVSMPETFAYIGAFSPAPGLLPYSSLGYPGQLTDSELTISTKYKEDTFILICNGKQDGVVYDVPYEYHKALSDNGVEHIYYTMDGGHDFNVWKNGLYHFIKNIFR